MGYLKVELRKPTSPSNPPLMELRVYQSDGSVNNYAGFMVELPEGIKPTDGVWQAFVRIPEDNRRIQEVMAVVAPDGLLRLYLFKGPGARGPSELRPLS